MTTPTPKGVGFSVAPKELGQNRRLRPSLLSAGVAKSVYSCDEDFTLRSIRRNLRSSIQRAGTKGGIFSLLSWWYFKTIEPNRQLN